MNAKSHRIGDVGELSKRDVPPAGFDRGDVGRRYAQASRDLSLRQPERAAGLPELATDDLRVNIG